MAALSVDGTPMPALPNSADQINYDNTTSGLSATTVKGAVDELASEKQDATDNNLATTNKTIVGGINEVKSGLNDLIKITNTPLDNSTLAPGGFKANACSISIPAGYTIAGFYIVTTGAYTSYCTFYTSVEGVIQATNTHQTETAELTGMVVALFVKTSFLS